MIDLFSSASLAAADWWDEINESRNWQDGIFFTLCGFYSLVSVIALVSFFFFLPFSHTLKSTLI